jgi:uncharacterized YigZ family protein
LKFVHKTTTLTYEIKKSKFITILTPYKEFEKTLSEIKSKHPKARHFVYAYRYLNEFDQVVENSSDDGEPKGTSGKPSLAVLKGHDAINIAVIIVRYFGGIRLGTGGLVRAYSTAVNQALEEAELLPFEKLSTYKITTTYQELSLVEYLLNKYSIDILKKSFESQTVLTIESDEKSILDLKKELEESHNTLIQL